MNFLIAAALISLTMPVLDISGNDLPAEKLAFIVWKVDELQPVAAGVALPSEQVSDIDVLGQYGCWFASAWILRADQQTAVIRSQFSDQACKEKPPYVCGSCH